ncbi:MAG: BamA/TamA family outer membrane protein [Taibaiella sp.]|nr:BamA/TamA family outer membrane protein [Taibaiella sp.]
MAWLLLLVISTGCSNTKYLAEGESLFTKAEVHFNNHKASKREEKALKEDMEGAVRPYPNKKLLGMRLRLAIYNRTDTPKREKGIRNWLKNKVGEPPVLMSDVDIAYNRKVLVSLLENHGFFQPDVKVSTETKRQKSQVRFEVVTGEQYKIKAVYYPDSAASELNREIFVLYDKSLLKAGDPYNFEVIKAERERINANLKNKGYYFFIPDYVLVQIDTTVGNRGVEMDILVKEEIPYKATRQYYIKDIYINPAYRTDSKRAGSNSSDTLNYENRYNIIGKTNRYKPSIFKIPMQFSPGERYSREDQVASVSKLVNMGTFKFVKNDFVELPGNGAYLDAIYNLTPYAKKSLQMEVAGVTKNDSRAGSQINISWRNRNTFRGAELFTIKGSAGFETQYSGVVRRPNTYQFGIEPSLTFPRFVIPFLDVPSSSRYVPKTIITTGYDLMIRNTLFRLHTFRAGYGFNWKEDARKEHEFFPFNITYVRADTLNTDSASQINFSNLLFNGIIVGPRYTYTFNTRGTGSIHKNDFYFTGEIDLSGNILGWAQGTSLDEPPKRLLGSAYAQYAKFTTELRHYNNYGVSKHAIWANRLLAGFGIPYGNSATLPNVKQYFSGGNSSLRGFRSRLVGPGTFNEQYNTGNTTFIETNGDIKLEANTELRAQLINFLHGAVFIDAGNIWTYRDNPNFPGGTFSSSFIKEIAVSGGVGLRLDFNILVLRLDCGIPLRKPWLPEDRRWVFNDIRLGDPLWRRQNLIFNLAIGYPF